MKKLRVTVEGKPYEVLVDILDEGASNNSYAQPPAPVAAVVSSASVSAAPVAPQPSRAASPGAAGPGDVPSPLAGKIVSVDVKPGDEVKEGAQVATIEAMKMNTYIFAPKAGRVGDILVKPGDAVDEGAILLRIA